MNKEPNFTNPNLNPSEWNSLAEGVDFDDLPTGTEQLEALDAADLHEAANIANAEESVTYTNFSNETATDRGFSDTIDSKADASDNPFEQNPDDSVDITAPYDDIAAMKIEGEIATEDEQ